MSKPILRSVRVMARLARLCPAMLLFSFPVAAQTNSSSYIFLLASGLLCDSGDSSTCPATAKSNQGDSYELSGAGTFDAQSKAVKGAGAYTHRSPNGNVLEAGVWFAGELVKFDSYGAAPGAIPRLGLALGPAPLRPKRFPTSAGSMPTGGLAVLRILLLPLRGGAHQEPPCCK
jgi:hypothetical protein